MSGKSLTQGVLMVGQEFQKFETTAGLLRACGFEVSYVREVIKMPVRHEVALVLIDFDQPDDIVQELLSKLNMTGSGGSKETWVIALTETPKSDLPILLESHRIQDLVLWRSISDELLPAVFRGLRKISEQPDISFPAIKSYSDGDVAFELELKSLFADNLVELNGAVSNVISSADRAHFRTTLHKCKTTIEVVNHTELHRLLAILRSLDRAEVIPSGAWRAVSSQLSICIEGLTSLLRRPVL